MRSVGDAPIVSVAGHLGQVPGRSQVCQLHMLLGRGTKSTPRRQSRLFCHCIHMQRDVSRNLQSPKPAVQQQDVLVVACFVYDMKVASNFSYEKQLETWRCCDSCRQAANSRSTETGAQAGFELALIWHAIMAWSLSLSSNTHKIPASMRGSNTMSKAF